MDALRYTIRKAIISLRGKELFYNNFMKTIAKFVPFAIAAFGLSNIIASFFTNNVWQGIAGAWMIISIPVFQPGSLVCPSANCCQNDKEGN